MLKRELSGLASIVSALGEKDFCPNEGQGLGLRLTRLGSVLKEKEEESGKKEK